MLQIRQLQPSEITRLYELIVESADEIGARNEVTTTPERLLEDAFGDHPCFEAILAWEEEIAVGFALWFPMYSGWKGRRTLLMEDLFVQPFWRKHGVATQLFREVEKRAIKAHANLAWECRRDRLELRRFFTGMGAIDRSGMISFYMEASDMQVHLDDTAPK